jgi:GTP-binding protein
VRAAKVKDFIKRFKYKGPVFEISALTREGCEGLIRDVFNYIHKVHEATQPAEYVDPRFVDAPAVVTELEDAKELGVRDYDDPRFR